jgi:hypothetical protein
MAIKSGKGTEQKCCQFLSIMQENLCTTTNKQMGPYIHHKMTKGDIAVYVQLSRGRCIWSVNHRDLYLLLQHHWNIFSECYLNTEFYVNCRKSVEAGSFPVLLLGYPSLKRWFRKEARKWWYYVLASCFPNNWSGGPIFLIEFCVKPNWFLMTFNPLCTPWKLFWWLAFMHVKGNHAANCQFQDQTIYLIAKFVHVTWPFHVTAENQ